MEKTTSNYIEFILKTIQKLQNDLDNKENKESFNQLSNTLKEYEDKLTTIKTELEKSIDTKLTTEEIDIRLNEINNNFNNSIDGIIKALEQLNNKANIGDLEGIKTSISSELKALHSTLENKIKNIELIKPKDGVDGKPGKDGYTPIKGKDYFDGKDGLDGEDGLSAYEIAKANGFQGTIEEWLRSLKGLPGLRGKSGKDGLTGSPGQQGTPGIPGNDGYTPRKGVDYFDGEQGIPGPAGAGIATGGTTNQILVKNSDTEFDTKWVNAKSNADTTLTYTLDKLTKVIKVENEITTETDFDYEYTGELLTKITKTIDSVDYEKVFTYNGTKIATVSAWEEVL